MTTGPRTSASGSERREGEKWLSVPTICPMSVIYWATLTHLISADAIPPPVAEEWPRHARPLPRRALCPLRQGR